MASFADVMKKIGEVTLHIAEVVAEHPEALAAILAMLEAARAARSPAQS